jgi:hypothetical protein
MSEIKAPKLTKKGLPDKRAETSKKNLEKGKSIIKEALKQVKEKQALKKSIPVVYSSDEYSTDEEEIEINQVRSEPVKSIIVSDNFFPPVLSRKDTKDREKINQANPVSSSPSKNIIPVISTDASKNIISSALRDSFSFEQTLNDRLKALDETYNKKLTTIEESNKLTREELNTIKAQNQALKKSMTSNFRTHAGVMNQEMYMRF